MNDLIERLFKKRNIKNVTELDPQEQIDYDRWQKILSEGEITVDKIKTFCENQIKIIESKWRELDNLQTKNDRLIIMHTIYKTLLEAIEKPARERESLEKYLNNLIET